MARLRVLVADDDPDLRNWLRAVLIHRGLVVLEAESGAELLEQLALSGPFDLVVADVQMSWASGVQALQMARGAGFTTPFVVITAQPSAAVRQAAEAMGANLLPKPFTVEQLVEAAGEALSPRPHAASR